MTVPDGARAIETGVVLVAPATVNGYPAASLQNARMPGGLMLSVVAAVDENVFAGTLQVMPAVDSMGAAPRVTWAHAAPAKPYGSLRVKVKAAHPALFAHHVLQRRNRVNTKSI